MFLTSCKNWSHWRWNQNFISNNWESNHKVIASLVYSKRPFPPFIQHNPTSAVLLMEQMNKPRRVYKKIFQRKDYLAMKKRLLPYIFQSSVTYVCAVFLFWRLVHRNRDRDISISTLGYVLEGKKGRMTVAQYWEMERKASKCLNNYLSSWVVT